MGSQGTAFLHCQGWMDSFLAQPWIALDHDPRPARTSAPDVSRLVGNAAQGGTMSSPANSRSLILDRIRTAVTPPPTDRVLPSPRKYVRHGQLSVQSRLHLMVSRLREYDADVLECAPEHLIAAIADRLQLSKRLQFVVPPQVPTAWQVPGLDWKVDNGMSYEEIEQCEGVITTAFAGIADSGTIVLHHSPSEGRRVVSLL